METGLQDKVALVAAGSRGLGRASALALAHEGAKVAIFSRSEANIEEAAESIRSETGAEVLSGVADVTDTEALSAFVDEVTRSFGPPRILINNAGGPPPGNFPDLTDDDWHRAFELTLMSVVHLCRAVIPSMVETGWGRIVNLTSISVKQPLANMVLSNTFRAGVHGLAKSLADELAPSKITVNCICTGLTRTERLRELAASKGEAMGVSTEDMLTAMAAQPALGRLGTVEEFGALVTFLCSEKAGYITGASIPIDGGLYRGLL